MTASRPPLLLTPGPLTTSDGVRAAMNRDWGSREADFIALTARVRARLLAVLAGHDGLAAVPIQGSGSFAVEAMIGTFVGRDDTLLVLINGSYGRRMVEMARIAGRRVEVIETPETEPVDPDRLDRRLAADPTIGTVAVVHCETTTGLLNPLDDVAAVVERHGRALLIDAMSSYGALPIAPSVRFAALASSANKCLEGIPGVGVVIARRDALAAAAGNAHSLVLDLAAQWRGFEANGQWRFTPPTHVVAALDRALADLEAEGGPRAREARYRANLAALVDGTAELGFAPLIEPRHQAPIIVTFPSPGEEWYDFAAFHRGLLSRGFSIYPGKTSAVDSFRVGCIGRVEPDDIVGFVGALREVLSELRREP